MGKKRGGPVSGGWNLLRLALRWARKGGVFKLGLLSGLRRSLTCVKKLKSSSSEVVRETPRFWSINRRPTSREASGIPCLRFPEYVEQDIADEERESEEIQCLVKRSSDEQVMTGDEEDEEEESIDVKAEKFIARFYEQLRLQNDPF